MGSVKENKGPEEKNSIENLDNGPPFSGEEIIISGISGTFPNSSNVHELMENLFNKAYLFSKTDVRWDKEHHEIPDVMGAIKDVDKYDSGFFGMHETEARYCDPLCRILLEKTIEAIFDAGLHPTDLENTNTGVVIGYSVTEELKTNEWTNRERSHQANRISYFLKLKGSSLTIDVACSSSMYAVEHAYRAMKHGEIDSAIVAGANTCWHPYLTLHSFRLGTLSSDCIPHVFDKKANGYVRSEAIDVIILQKAKNAKRIYAEIVHAKINCDGFKENGINHPSCLMQTQLLKDLYEECEVDPSSLSYIEAHGTGTSAGDSAECAAIDRVLTKGRKSHLLVGSVKSNLGHSEAAAGVTSVIKGIIAMETGFIPPNVNFEEPAESILGIKEGRLKIVTEKTAFEDNRGLVGVSSFGFGGANSHTLLRRNPKVKINLGIPADNMPRLVCVSGRSRKAVKLLLDELKDNCFDAEHIALLHNIFRKKVPNHIYRGYTIISKSGEISRGVKFISRTPTALYLVLGELNKWHDIGRSLMAVPSFGRTMYSIQKHIVSEKINIVDAILNESVDNDHYFILGNIAVQIGLIDLLKSENIKVLNYPCNFYGKLLSSYVDGTVTLKEVVECALIVNEACNNVNKVINSKGSIQVGKSAAISESSYYPEMYYEILREALISEPSLNEKILQNLLVSIDPKQNCTGKYMENLSGAKNIFSFLSNNNDMYLKSIKSMSVVVTMGDFAQQRMEEESVDIISLISSENQSHLVNLFDALGELYLNGCHFHLGNLYPEIQFPVSRGTCMISPYIKWNHKRKLSVPRFTEKVISSGSYPIKVVGIQLSERQWSFINGHVIDGRNLFPATGYLFLAWKVHAEVNNVSMHEMNIVFQDCQFLKATTIPEKEVLQFSVAIMHSGRFEIVQEDSLVATGKLYVVEEEKDHEVNDMNFAFSKTESKVNLKTKDIYKELRLRGYNYSKSFRGIQQCNVSASKAHIRCDGNWITFMDNMLQMNILQRDTRLLYVPTYIKNVAINGGRHREWVKNYSEDGTVANLPVHCNPFTGIISSGFIKICGPLANSIARRKDLGIPVLEKYVFVPNNATLEMEGSVRVNIQILLENTLGYKVKGVEFTDSLTVPLLPLVKSVLEDQPLVTPQLKILSNKDIDSTILVEHGELRNETDCMLIIASHVLTEEKVRVEALSALNSNGFIISRENIDFSPETETLPNISVITVHKTPSETLVLLRKSMSRSMPFGLKITDDDEFLWIAKLQDIIKKKYEDVVLYAEGESSNGILGLVNCLRREPESSHVRCVLLMDQRDKKFNLLDPLFTEQLRKNLAINIFKNGTWGTYRHLLIDKPMKTTREHCLVTPMVRGDLSSLEWIEGPLSSKIKLPADHDPKYYVHVNYCSLNFRDVMTASAKINADLITKDRLVQEYVEGIEFSGRDEEGNRVCGLVGLGALSTVVVADRCSTYSVPDDMSLKEAATIPVVYSTVIGALVMRCNIQQGSSILIHSGTGGVGQAAIRIALSYNCTIFTTVGSDEKREFLKKTFPELKDSYIGSSRDISFEEMVLRETNGEGVDIVLNSLAEEKLIASVRCLAKGGNFVEIGKFDLANNNELNLNLLNKEAAFHGFMLDHLIHEPPSVKIELVNLFRDALNKGVIKPLNTTVFKFNEIERAFRFLGSGKHTGKVLVEIKPEDSGLVVSENQQFPCNPRYICDPEKTYVIIGGLGGFGLELADWLVLRGATRLVLTSRNGVVTGYQSLRIRRWESYAVLVHISKADIKTEVGCKRLLEEANKLGPVDAIFNLAVVLADGIFENQTKESFIISFDPKAVCTKHLDKITRDLCPVLRNFVVFSSVSCGRGNAGQSNYGMANSLMERICEKRKAEGYPALAIQWGAVGDVGLVAELQEDHFELEIGGTLSQKISGCLKVLDVFLTQDDSTIVSSMVVAEKRGGVNATHDMVDAIVDILGISDVKSVSMHSLLSELGMDSITAAEIKQILAKDFGVSLTNKEFRRLTLARLKELQDEHNRKGQTVDVPKKVDNGIGLNFIMRQLHKQLSTDNPLIKLKSRVSETTTKQILFFPGIDGVSTALEPLASQTDAQILCLQYSNEILGNTIQDIAKILLPFVLEHVTKTKTFYFVAYSYGSLIALEIVHILETNGYLGHIVLIDTSPAALKELLNYSVDVKTELLCHLLTFFVPSDDISVFQDDIKKCQSWSGGRDLMIKLIENRLGEKVDWLKPVSDGLYQKIRMLMEYEPSYKKLNSKMVLLRAQDTEFENIGNDYQLSDITENLEKVEVIDGNHSTMLEDEIIALKLNNYLNKFMQ